MEGGRLSLGAFETSLPIRMDFEAMLAYLLLPPAGGVFLLLVEHKSDYVRYVISMEILPFARYIGCELRSLTEGTYFSDFMPGNLACCLP